MKKSVDKKSKKNDDLEDMKAAFRRHNDRQKGGSSKNDWDKFGDGKNLRRFLPRPGERKFYTESWTHFNVGPNDKAVRCLDEESIDKDRGLPTSGTTCHRCKKFLREQARINSEYKKGDEDGQEEWKRAKDKYVPRHQFYSNTLRADSEGDFEVVKTVYGPQVWGQLMNYYLGDDTDVGDFTDPRSGKWLNIKKEKKGGRDRRNVEYKVFPVEGPDISDAWSAIEENLHDLELAAGKILSQEEFTAIEKGINIDKESGPDDDDDAENDRSRKKRSKSDDDDDDSGNSGSGDDEPVRAGKSKLAGKMKKRSRDD